MASNKFSVNNNLLLLCTAHILVAKTECTGWLQKCMVRLQEVYGWLMGSILSVYVFYGRITVLSGGLRFRSKVYSQCTDDTPINFSATCYYYIICKMQH